MNQKELQNVEKRTVGYWFEDGVFDIVIGAGFALLGLSYFAVEAIQPISWLAEVAGLIQIVLLLLVFFFLGKVVKKIKERVVYPRTGQVVYKQRSRSERFLRGMRSGVLSFLFAAAFSIFALAPNMHQVLPAIMGGLFAVAFMILGWRVGVMRYFITGGGIFIAGLGVSLLNSPFINQTGILFVAVGLVLAATGLAGLISYLRQNPLDAIEQGQK